MSRKTWGEHGAGIAVKPHWTMARRHRSPRCTSEWDELLAVRAG
ncbi:DUF4113 domain-containing protein [Arthrobacter sp. GCM10027362]